MANPFVGDQKVEMPKRSAEGVSWQVKGEHLSDHHSFKKVN